MKLYLRNRFTQDIRPRRATHDEILARIEHGGDGGISTGDELMQVTITDDGDIIATPLTDKDVAMLRLQFEPDRVAAFRALLDDALKLHRKGAGFNGIRVEDAIKIWGDAAPWAVEELVAWASEQGLVIDDTPRPSKLEKSWIRVMQIYENDGSSWHSDAIVRVQWSSIDVDPEADVAVEIMCHAFASFGRAPTSKDGRFPEIEKP